MPIGDFEEVLYRNPVARFLARHFGAKGLHDHLRIAPLLSYATTVLWRRGRLHVLEVGCGEGLSLFELAKVADITAEGYDLDGSDIAVAEQIAAKRFPDRFRFYATDATGAQHRPGSFDVVLLMDFLEHIDEPAQLLVQLDEALRPGGELIISVPTPVYPRVFGREMHDRIGHKVDGYTEESLHTLVPAGYERVMNIRNTGRPAQFGCALQARLNSRIHNPYLSWLLALPLLALKRADWWNGERSCSLFAVYRKSGTRPAPERLHSSHLYAVAEPSAR